MFEPLSLSAVHSLSIKELEAMDFQGRTKCLNELSDDIFIHFLRELEPSKLEYVFRHLTLERIVQFERKYPRPFFNSISEFFWADLVNQNRYRQEKENLLIAYDAIYSITSTIETESYEQSDQIISARVLVRDARHQSHHFNPNTHNPESPEVLAIDFKLRSLMLMRAIHYAMTIKKQQIAERYDDASDITIQKHLEKIFKHYCVLQSTLIKKYESAISSDNLTSKKKIEKAERAFNTNLALLLNAANLDEGVKSECDFEKLLFRYRTYASVLDPALGMRTTFAANGEEFEETATPITVNTDEQKQQLKETISGVDLSTKKNFHAIGSGAEQEVNYIFRDLMMMDDRMLGPQSRKMIPIGNRNAYVISFNMSGDDARKFEYVRCSMPGFIGKGETKEAIIAFTKNNVDQLEACVDGLDGFHFLVLLTDPGKTIAKIHDDNGEHFMSETLKAVVLDENSELTMTMTQIPQNILGRIFPITSLGQYALNYKKLPGESFCTIRPRGFVRLEAAGEAALQIVNSENDEMLIISCASAKERTGKVALVLTSKQVQDWRPDWSDDQMREFDDQYIQSLTVLVVGNVNLPPGHTGLKPMARPSEYGVCGRESFFRKTNDKLIFRKVANKLKKTPFSDLPSYFTVNRVAKEEYLIARQELELICDENMLLRPHLEKILKISDKQFRKAKSADTNLLAETLRRIKITAEKPTEENIQDLEHLTKKMKGKGSTFAKVIAGILCVLGLMLVIAGVVGIPFSMGSSTLLSGVGLSIMSATLGGCLASIGVTTGLFQGRSSNNFKGSGVVKLMERFAKNQRKSPDYKPAPLALANDDGALVHLHDRSSARKLG